MEIIGESPVNSHKFLCVVVTAGHGRYPVGRENSAGFPKNFRYSIGKLKILKHLPCLMVILLMKEPGEIKRYPEINAAFLIRFGCIIPPGAISCMQFRPLQPGMLQLLKPIKLDNYGIVHI